MFHPLLYFMKKIFGIYILICIYQFSYSASIRSISFALPGGVSLSGKITDKENNEGIPGVSVYFPDLKTGTITRVDGTYYIQDLPATKLLVKVSMIGYTTVSEFIDMSATATKDFVMEN